jgi:hypothetical protein
MGRKRSSPSCPQVAIHLKVAAILAKAVRLRVVRLQELILAKWVYRQLRRQHLQPPLPCRNSRALRRQDNQACRARLAKSRWTRR